MHVCVCICFSLCILNCEQMRQKLHGSGFVVIQFSDIMNFFPLWFEVSGKIPTPVPLSGGGGYKLGSMLIPGKGPIPGVLGKGRSLWYPAKGNCELTNISQKYKLIVMNIHCIFFLLCLFCFVTWKHAKTLMIRNVIKQNWPISKNMVVF